MKTHGLFIILLSVFVTITSCEKPKENTVQDILIKDLAESQRYDLQMIKNNEGTLFGIYLDRFDGSVYIWKGSKIASRVATGELELPSYDGPTYKITVFLNDKNNPDIYLFDASTSNLYQFSLGNMGNFKEVNIDLK